MTGDFLFSTFDSGDKIVLVRGFASPSAPTPTPAPTATPRPDSCRFRVLLAYANANGQPPPQIINEIRADQDVAAVDLFDASAGTPSLTQLQQYDIVMPFSNNRFNNAALLGDNLADYVDGGGVVVQAANGFVGPGAPNGINGRWVTGNYNPFNYTTQQGTAEFTTYIHDKTHPLMAGVTALNFNFESLTTLAPGATRVASGLPGGHSVVAYRPVNGGHITVGITAFLGLDGAQSGDWARLIVNAGRWLRPCAPAPTPTATATATATATPAATPRATATATATPIATATATATATPVATPTATPTPAATATATPQPTASATPSATPALNSRLANISTRMRVEAGDNVLIAGFIIEGNANKRIMLRGVGPSLAVFGVPEPLQDPTLELSSGGSLITTNDNWPDSQNATEIANTGLAPANVKESAVLITLAPGAYTAILRGKDNGAGVGLVEVYDLSAESPARVINISTRGYVLTGENVMIGGLIITGNEPSQVVIRALGPSLGGFGVPDPLADPLLELHDAQGDTISISNDWRDNEEQGIIDTGLAPGDNLESAILTSLPPGSYTAIVKSADGGVGNGLVEVYKLSP